MEQQVKKSIFKKWWFWIIVVILVLWVIGASSKDNQQTETQTQPEQKTEGIANEAKTQPIAEIPQKQIPYEIVKRWTIPNGGEGKLIVISPNYFNEADMTLLGQKLRDDTLNDRNATISVFDDKKATLLRDKVASGELTATEESFYEKHFIGQYNKNGNTGYNQYTIYLDGVMGTNQKTIKY